MFVYEKKLQYPINIKNTNPKLAALIISQYGGPYINNIRKPPPVFWRRFLVVSHRFKIRTLFFRDI